MATAVLTRPETECCWHSGQLKPPAKKGPGCLSAIDIPHACGSMKMLETPEGGLSYPLAGLL